MYAQLRHYFHLTPADIDELHMTQVNGYMDQVAMLEWRRHYPMAVMIAQQGNFSGGRSKKKPTKASDSVPYKPSDFMPYLWHANYKPYMELTGGRSELEDVDVDALRELYERRNDISSMFYMSLDWPNIRVRLGIVED